MYILFVIISAIYRYYNILEKAINIDNRTLIFSPYNCLFNFKFYKQNLISFHAEYYLKL